MRLTVTPTASPPGEPPPMAWWRRQAAIPSTMTGTQDPLRRGAQLTGVRQGGGRNFCVVLCFSILAKIAGFFRVFFCVFSVFFFRFLLKKNSDSVKFPFFGPNFHPRPKYLSILHFFSNKCLFLCKMRFGCCMRVHVFRRGIKVHRCTACHFLLIRTLHGFYSTKHCALFFGVCQHEELIISI